MKISSAIFTTLFLVSGSQARIGNRELQAEGIGSCLVPINRPGCDNAVCEQAVCSSPGLQDCCDRSWYPLCVSRARVVCQAQINAGAQLPGGINGADALSGSGGGGGSASGSASTASANSPANGANSGGSGGPSSASSDSLPTSGSSPKSGSPNMSSSSTGGSPKKSSGSAASASSKKSSDNSPDAASGGAAGASPSGGGGSPGGSGSAATGAAAGIANCFQARVSPGCGDATCQSIVCAVDPQCCNVNWYGACVTEARANCTPLF